MSKLTDNTIVVRPDTLVPVVLEAGQVLPDWAVGLVGEHLLSGAPKPGKSDDSKPASPLDGLKGPELKAYAAEHGIDLGGATKVGDMRAAIEAVLAEAAEAESGPVEGDGDEEKPEDGDGDSPDAGTADEN